MAGLRAQMKTRGCTHRGEKRAAARKKKKGPTEEAVIAGELDSRDKRARGQDSKSRTKKRQQIALQALPAAPSRLGEERKQKTVAMANALRSRLGSPYD